MPKRIESNIENALWSFRYVIIIAVLALLASSLVAFYIGVLSTIHAFSEAFSHENAKKHPLLQ